MGPIMENKPDTFLSKKKITQYIHYSDRTPIGKPMKQIVMTNNEALYPKYLESQSTTKTGINFFLRPVKTGDELLFKEFFRAVSDLSIYRRFGLKRKMMADEKFQELVNIDYMTRLVIIAIVKDDEKERAVGIGQYIVNETTHTAEIALAVRDDFQNMGIGASLLSKLTYEGKIIGRLFGFTAEVPETNQPMLHLFYTMGFYVQRLRRDGICYLKMWFRK